MFSWPPIFCHSLINFHFSVLVRCFAALNHDCGSLLLVLLNLLVILDARLEEGVWMVSDVVGDGVGVRELEEPEAGHLMQILSPLLHDDGHVGLGQAVGGKELAEVVFAKILKRTPMILFLPRRLHVDDLLAGPRLVVVALTFLPIAMSDIVRIVLFEFVAVNFFAEFSLPELEGLVDVEAEPFQIKSKLQPAEMLQVTLIPQRSEEHLHARREALLLVIVEVGESDLVGVLRCLNFRQVELDRIMIAQINQKLAQPLILQNRRKEFEGTVQFGEELVFELGARDLIKIRHVHVREALVQEHLSLGDEV